MVRSFQWNIPEFFNIGEAVSGYWAKHDPDRLAIIDEREDGSVREWSFLALDRLANRFANALVASGAREGTGSASTCPSALKPPPRIWARSKPG